MIARIYRPAKNAMQSGRALTKTWVLEFDREQGKTVDPLMGWSSSGDMRSQVRLKFETREAAENYARRCGIPFRVVDPKERSPKQKAYADNFKFGRIDLWTH